MTTINKYTRDKKGKSLIDSIKDYTIIDIETTGLDPKYDDIIEVAGIKIRDDKIVDEFSSLINPSSEINEFISDLTGITNDMLKDAPTIEKIIKEYLDFIGDDTVIGHNVNFDINFIYDNCERILNKPFSNDFIDTMRLSLNYNPEMKHNRLIDLIDKYNIDVEKQHRALDDCKSTLEVYKHLKEEVIKKYGNVENFNSMKKSKVKTENYTTNNTNIDITNPFYDKECVATGKLERMTRNEYMQLIVDLGGKNRDTVTKDTNYLILGNTDYSKNVKNKKTSKMIKAEENKLKGYDIEIISENVFYDMIDSIE